MTTALQKAIALAAAAATPFAIAAFAAWSIGPAVDGDRDVPAAVVNLDEMVTTVGDDGTESVMFAGRQVVTELVDDETDGIEFRILNAEDAAEQLARGDVHAVVTIPADFSERVLSLQGDEPRQAGIEIVTDASTDALATELAAATGESVVASFGDLVTSGFIAGLFGGYDALAEQLGVAADGADAVGSGGAELASGLGELADGIDDLGAGAGAAEDGARQLATGGRQLAAGLAAADDGIGQLAGGAASLSDGITQYTGGVDALASGAASLSDGVDGYTAGVDQLAGGAAQLVAALEADPSTDPATLEAARQLAGGLAQLGLQEVNGQPGAGAALRDGASQLADGAAQASAGSPALRDGASQLAGGLTELDGGFGASVDGAQRVSDGTRELAAGMQQLESGAVQLAAGGRSAQTGAAQLGDGASELGDGLREGVAAMPQLGGDELADLSSVATDPVGFGVDEQGALPSGEARIAALAVPIGLWLGALALVLVLARTARRIAASAESDARVLATLLARSAWVVVVQALLAALVVHAIGGVAWASLPATLGVTLLFAAAAGLLQLALVAWWGPAGAAVSLVLLGLQAVAAGGLVPRDVLGGPFEAIAPVLPMTHAVDALQAIAAGSGAASAALGGSIAMLVLFVGVGLLAAALALRSARRRATGERIRALDALAPPAGAAPALA